MQVYLHKGGQQLGPFTEAEIREKLVAGTVGTEDLVWWEGQSGWALLGATPLVINATLPASSATAAPVPVGVPPASMNAEAFAPPSQTSGLAIGSLVCGITSLVIGLTFIPAIVLGHLALNKIRKTPGLKGRGMAIAGLVLGYALPMLAFVAVVIISILIALGQPVKGVFSTIQAQQAIQQPQGS